MEWSDSLVSDLHCGLPACAPNFRRHRRARSRTRKWGSQGAQRLSLPVFGPVTLNFLETPMNPLRKFPQASRLVAALSLAGSALIGCGGSDPTNGSSSATEQPASVEITETPSALTVSASLPSGSVASRARSASEPAGKETETETASVTQAVQFAFKLGDGSALQGTLSLRTETEAGGVTEIEGRLVPAAAAASAAAAAPAVASAASAATKVAFDASKDALKTALRAAIDKAKSTYEAAVADAASNKTDARTAFKTAVADAVNTYRTALAAAATAAGITQGQGRGAGGGHAQAKGAEVEGTMDAAGKLTLTLKQRGVASGSLTATTAPATALGNATIKGLFTGMVNGATLTDVPWEATPAAPGAVPVAPTVPVPTGDCKAQTVTWGTGNACSAKMSALPDQGSTTLTFNAGGTSGSISVMCQATTVVKSAAASCTTTAPPAPPSPVVNPPPVTPPVVTPVGNVAAGLTKYASNCSGCHGLGKASDNKVNTAAGLTGVMNAVGSHTALRTSLTAQDRLDIAAYVASPK